MPTMRDVARLAGVSVQTVSCVVNGSAMPYFTVYTGNQVNALMDYLDAQYGTFRRPDPVTTAVSSAAARQAAQTFGTTCAACNGPDGSGATATSRGLLPPPPDFRQFSLTSERAFQVITAGYPGTAMAPNNGLPEDVRWGLVKYVASPRKD